jgi:hypothetical protein
MVGLCTGWSVNPMRKRVKLKKAKLRRDCVPEWWTPKLFSARSHLIAFVYGQLDFWDHTNRKWKRPFATGFSASSSQAVVSTLAMRRPLRKIEARAFNVPGNPGRR